MYVISLFVRLLGSVVDLILRGGQIWGWLLQGMVDLICNCYQTDYKSYLVEIYKFLLSVIIDPPLLLL